MEIASRWIKNNLVFAVIGLLTSVNSCKPESALLPDPQPAKAIEGIYQARTFRENGEPINYPINGQTLSLQIKPLTADTVQVDILATPNGRYSPGQTLSYSKAFVISKKQSDGKITYYVYLTTPPDECGYNTLWIYSNKEMDYYFIPPGNRPCVGARIRFVKE